MSAKKILFIVHLPPPVHGVSVMNRIIKNSTLINQAFSCDFINISLASGPDDFRKHRLLKYIKTCLIFFKTTAKLYKNSYDLAYITPFPFGVAFYKDALFIALCKRFVPNIYLHLHTHGFKSAAKGPFKKRLYQKTFKSTQVICLSQRLIEDIEGLYRGPISIVPNGIPVINTRNTYVLREKPLQIVFLSNLISGKGVLLLLEAFKNLVLKGFSHQLVIAGADADITRQQLIEYTQEHQLESRVKILGPVYDAQKHELLQSSDLLVLPSNYDTFGLVLLEAMQFGLPCIATSFGGIPDVLGDGRGILLKERSVGAIEQALKELCEQPELRLQISQKAFAYFHEHFTQAYFEKRCRDVLNGKPETLVYL